THNIVTQHISSYSAIINAERSTHYPDSISKPSEVVERWEGQRGSEAWHRHDGAKWHGLVRYGDANLALQLALQKGNRASHVRHAARHQGRGSLRTTS